MKLRENYRLNIGGASIILILTVFALTVFAILSIKASYHEFKLTQKTKEAAEEYYRADALAEDVLMNVNHILDSKKNESPYVIDSTWFDGLKSMEDVKNITYTTDSLCYEVYIGEYAVLQVQLKLNHDDNEGIQVVSWKTVANEQNNYGESLNLWEGNVNE